MCDTVLDNTTPKEAFTSIKPNLSHLRIFGCLVYVYIPKDKRTKLEPFGKKGILIRYSENSKGYRVYIPGQRTIEISRDVKFEEDVAFNLSKNNDEIFTEPTIERNEDHPKENERENDTSSPLSTSNDVENKKNKKRPFWAKKFIE